MNRKRIAGVNLALTVLFIIVPAVLIDIGREIVDNWRWSVKISKRLDGRKQREIQNLFRKIEYKYAPFVGWRAKDIESEYVNVIGGERYVRPVVKDGESYWMFGGSTMFGFLVDDNETVPSVVSKELKVNTRNLGVSGWNSRQSLNLLMGELMTGSPKGVVFMDGVNDVMHGCRREIRSIPSHSLEHDIHIISTLKARRDMLLRLSGGYILGPIEYIQGKLSMADSLYICDIDRTRAQSVADNLVESWRIAYDTLRTRGIKMLFVLQPTLYDSAEVLSDDKRFSEVMEREFRVVYSLIEKRLVKECGRSQQFCDSIVNARSVLVKDSNEFIDDNHLTGSGNEVLGRYIARELEIRER